MIDSRFISNFREMSVTELCDICSFKMYNDVALRKDFVIKDVSTLNCAQEDDLSFFGNRKYLHDFKSTNAGVVIISEENISDLPKNTIGIIVKHVQIGFAKALDVLIKENVSSNFISSKSFIHKNAKIGNNCSIGDNTIIGDMVIIGDNSVIGANCVIENGCIIGECAEIRNNVTITHAIIGSHVKINSGARLGESGFGILPTGSGMVYVKQIGKLLIGDRVRIGANTTIDRGSVEDTVIGNDTIIDNLVQIAHNVKIGCRSIIVSQVGIAGSTIIGNDVVLAGQVGVAGHLKIGDRVAVSAKSGIISDVESGKTVGGIPAVDIGTWRRQSVYLKNIVTKKRK